MNDMDSCMDYFVLGVFVGFVVGVMFMGLFMWAAMAIAKDEELKRA